MPELPEIEILVRRIREELIGKPVLEVVARDPESNELQTRKAKQAATIVGARRFGKMFSIDLDNRRSVFAHLMLWGQAGFGDKETCLAARPTLALRVGDNEYFWICQVAPRFVTMLPTVGIQKLEEVKRLGVDALSRGLSEKRLTELLATDGRPVKSILMDQSTIAGIGNTYADEILFEARIAPKHRGRELDEAQVQSLFRAIRRVLRSAVKAGEGKASGASASLRVHEKANQPCPECGEPIRKTRLGQRPTYWCPQCQPLDRED